jgi:hypothetical protein
MTAYNFATSGIGSKRKKDYVHVGMIYSSRTLNEETYSFTK